jgi:hypothetical protein
MNKQTYQVKSIPSIQKRIAVLWPSFIMASVATLLYFLVIEPLVLPTAAGIEAIDHPRLCGTVFVLSWLVTASSSYLTCFFQKSCDEVNHEFTRKMRS